MIFITDALKILLHLASPAILRSCSMDRDFSSQIVWQRNKQQTRRETFTRQSLVLPEKNLFFCRHNLCNKQLCTVFIRQDKNRRMKKKGETAEQLCVKLLAMA